MSKRPTMKLFAVALLAAASPASASPAASSASAESYIEISIKTPTIKPRVLNNARPACGNTGGKVDRPSNCTAAEEKALQLQQKEDERVARINAERYAADQKRLMAVAEAVVRADPSVKPRLLLNGRPACGNTMAKSAPPLGVRLCSTTVDTKLAEAK